MEENYCVTRNWPSGFLLFSVRIFNGSSFLEMAPHIYISNSQDINNLWKWNTLIPCECLTWCTYFQINLELVLVILVIISQNNLNIKYGWCMGQISWTKTHNVTTKINI